MSELERKWWYAGLIGGLTGFSTAMLLDLAGLPISSGRSAAQWMLYAVCFGGLWRGYTLLGRAIVFCRDIAQAGSGATGAPRS